MEVTSFRDISLNSIKGVLIDLDDTIYSYQKAHNQALIDLFKCWNLDDRDFDNFKHLYRSHRNNVTKDHKPLASCRSRLLAFLALFEELKVERPYIHAFEFSELYWDYLRKNALLDSEAEKFLIRCKDLNIPTCLVTDLTLRVQIQKIQSLNISKFITHIVTSEEACEEKPAKSIFQKALDKLGLRANEVVMIGDSYQKDIIGAKNLNIKAYQIKLAE